MFYTIVSPFVQTVLEKLSSDVLQGVCDAYGLKDELNGLENTLQTIQLVLYDAESKQRKNKALHHWLLELKNAACEAEDILDLVATEGLSRQMDRERGKRLKSTLSSIVDIVVPDVPMLSQVKAIRGKLDSIVEKKTKFHLSEGILDSKIGEGRQTSSLVNELEIYGRNEEKDLIVNMILHVSDDRNEISVHAMCGMGGIGKTTLAQLVYNDDKVKNHFELRIWVCVSDDFSVKRLTNTIIESIDKGHPCVVNDLDPLQRLLQEKLRGKRYLLIMDDVWNEDENEWDKLKEALRCGSKGSVVIVTTRNEKIAIMMGSTSPHHLQYLSEDDSWSLFRKRAFVNRQEDGVLVEIGKQIVKKCGGVPLAVKALGSLMSFKSSESEWEVIQKSEIWQLGEDEKGILPALRLSYDNLPYYMKQCFAYCCIFPKDYEMDKKELIQLWMANGFIPSELHRNLAQAGHEIFQELVWRSFFQDVTEVKSFYNKNWGHILCKMHDLMHDLAQSVMRHEIREYSNHVPKNLKSLRHLSFTKCHVSRELSTVSSLRSVIIMDRGVLTECDKEDFFSFLLNQKYLRVLKLIGLFSDCVFKLQHLRHLVLEVRYLRTLPESLTHLHNLQSLKLENTHNLRELPKDMKYLKNLYFLDMDDIRSLVSTPPDLGELKYLQTLPTFIVGEDSSHQIHQLKDLNLEGELTIQGLYYVRNFEDAKSANLIAKKNLIHLKLDWKIKGARNFIYTMMEGLFDEVLEGLQPNQNLKRIYISDFPGSRLPNWLLPLHLKNLMNIYVQECERLEHLPPLGEFPHLTYVRLDDMKSIKRLDVEWHGDGEASFAALEDLSISNMHVLEEWIVPEGYGHFSSLKYLRIEYCYQILSIPTALFEMVSSTLLHLDIHNCPKVESLPESMKQLTDLQVLLLRDCEGFHSLPDWLWSLPSLSKLSIQKLSNLECLPDSMQQQSSLIELHLCRCEKLRSLPDSLGSLNSLTCLYMTKCPLVEERCMKPNGQDWPKISHIPQIEINCETIQSLGG